MLDSSVMVTTDYRVARRHLMRADPVLREILKAHPAHGPTDASQETALQALTRALVSQQLSVKAAETIYSRFLALFPGGRFPRPEQVLSMPVERLRGVGMSWRKAAYLRDLCSRAADQSLPLDSLGSMSDDEVMETLTAVKGIGRWTAEMILIFQLGRPDVLPLDDVGLLRAIQKAYGFKRRPSPVQVTRLGERWRPYRSAACWYLWASLDGG